MSDDTVRVPWPMGVEVSAAPRPMPDTVGRLELCQRKAESVRADLDVLGRRHELCAAPGLRKRRETVEREIDFQKRRIAWLETFGKMPDEDLRARSGELERELGGEASYLEDGLPRELAQDMRLVSLLGELALVRYALRAREEV